MINNQSRTNEICKYAQDKNVGVVLLNSNEGNRASSESLQAMKSYAEGQGFNGFMRKTRTMNWQTPLALPAPNASCLTKQASWCTMALSTTIPMMQML